MNFDVIVVGAGPAGSTVANVLAEKGYAVLILEEHTKIGLPQHCTGKISVNASNELKLPRTGILQEVSGATIYSPDMDFFSIERPAIQAYIYDRTVLDKWLANRASDAGAKLLTGARVIDISRDKDGMNVIFKRSDKVHKLSTQLVVGADGVPSIVTQRLGLSTKTRAEVKIAVQSEIVKLHGVKSGFVELYFGRTYAPGFFAWIVPTGDRSVKVGLGVEYGQSKYIRTYLDNFIKKHPIVKMKLKGGICTGQITHIIPTGGTIRQTVCDGALIVGDAAGQVKSTTGGGLYFGMYCAKIAGEVVSKALSSSQKILYKGDLIEYQKLWRNTVGREINNSVRFRRLLDSLTDEEVTYLFHIIREDELSLKLIKSRGDIDWQSQLSIPLFKHLISVLIKRPKLFLKLKKLLL